MLLSTIAFDADDTLWENEHIFVLTQERFVDFLKDYAPAENLYESLLATEWKNLQYYGYGIKGFTLSMIETAIEVTRGEIPARVVQEILNAGREMKDHPATVLPNVKEVLAKLKDHYRIVMITKGDLFDQERKLAQSGLGDFFDAIEIVSDKNEQTYHRIFDQFGDGPAQSMMIGNSLKSDIIPAIEAGAWGIYIPSSFDWAVERADAPSQNERFRQIKEISELPELIETLLP
ncbi:MAG: HAD hydrolase-like protein [Sneathiella sp.]|nr:HAD hydrolase-like protein [Sneathiella sp.]